MSDERGDKIRILLIDDHSLFREGLVRLLEAESDFQIVGHCPNVKEALQMVSTRPVDVVLLDYELGTEKGSEFLQWSADNDFPGRTLVLTAGVNGHQARQLLGLSAAGIFFKHDSPELLAKCIREVDAGRSWLDPKLVKELAQQELARSTASRSASLTERERGILRNLLEGLSNKEIGSRLGISESAVKAVLQQLFNKTGVRTRSQLVRIALEQYRGEL